ncbi:L,D-transpeptidase [Formosa maritima]|uniref:L,D-transpeptidase n=1 Tax=Formosa maritima TaxID=2592046 RepID=A0A5D0GGZ4_9FLAO|nr:L,D-transpeptidase [Formosa maritima]TYA58060.1 L,D-transpeptidase [Formosa maritima]
MLIKTIYKSLFLTILIIISISSLTKTKVPLSYILIKTKTFQDSSRTIYVSKNVQIKNYFQYLDSIVTHFNSNQSYNISEHILVRNNPWIIDSLANTDYYRMMARDTLVYNQKDLIVLKKGSKIIIPDSLETQKLLKSIKNTWIDVNIPEYKLRIYEDSVMLYKFPVRVGRNETKYLKMGNRITDLKTIPGNGKIVAHVKNPDYYNPATGKQYFVTKRDDNKTTKLPQIPFIETEINGIRYGQLIHPTTNPITLNRAYSNGCIGTNEADAWIIYYYAPINTKIKIRYDLNVTNEIGEKMVLEDIYGK